MSTLEKSWVPFAPCRMITLSCGMWKCQSSLKSMVSIQPFRLLLFTCWKMMKSIWVITLKIPQTLCCVFLSNIMTTIGGCWANQQRVLLEDRGLPWISGSRLPRQKDWPWESRCILPLHFSPCLIQRVLWEEGTQIEDSMTTPLEVIHWGWPSLQDKWLMLSCMMKIFLLWREDEGLRMNMDHPWMTKPGGKKLARLVH